jgi:hypothetical protein
MDGRLSSGGWNPRLAGARRAEDGSRGWQEHGGRRMEVASGRSTEGALAIAGGWNPRLAGVWRAEDGSRDCSAAAAAGCGADAGGRTCARDVWTPTLLT